MFSFRMDTKLNKIMSTNNKPFIASGYRSREFFTYQIQISDDGSAARIRLTCGALVDPPTKWTEIKYDDKGEAFICIGHNIEYLSKYILYDK